MSETAHRELVVVGCSVGAVGFNLALGAKTLNNSLVTSLCLETVQFFVIIACAKKNGDVNRLHLSFVLSNGVLIWSNC